MFTQMCHWALPPITVTKTIINDFNTSWYFENETWSWLIYENKTLNNVQHSKAGVGLCVVSCLCLYLYLYVNVSCLHNLQALNFYFGFVILPLMLVKCCYLKALSLIIKNYFVVQEIESLTNLCWLCSVIQISSFLLYFHFIFIGLCLSFL